MFIIHRSFVCQNLEKWVHRENMRMFNAVLLNSAFFVTFCVFGSYLRKQAVNFLEDCFMIFCCCCFVFCFVVVVLWLFGWFGLVFGYYMWLNSLTNTNTVHLRSLEQSEVNRSLSAWHQHDDNTIIENLSMDMWKLWWWLWRRWWRFGWG